MEIGLIEQISKWTNPYDTAELYGWFCFIICFGAELWFI